MFTSSGFTEERVERVISTTNSFITWHLTVGLNPVLQTIQLPTGVAHLAPGLTNMH
jgi:hypothetical protein